MSTTEVTAGVTLFETAIGRCGIAWGARGIRAVRLPAPREDLTRSQLLRRAPGTRGLPPPPTVQRTIDGIRALLAGSPRDLSTAKLDMDDIAPFDRSVYEAARTIRPGETLTYGEVAARISEPLEARAVGTALARNRFPIIVPCHRVVAAGGKLGGFSAPGGAATKARLLSIERPHADQPPNLFDAAGFS